MILLDRGDLSVERPALRRRVGIVGLRRHGPNEEQDSRPNTSDGQSREFDEAYSPGAMETANSRCSAPWVTLL